MTVERSKRRCLLALIIIIIIIIIIINISWMILQLKWHTLCWLCC